MSGEASSRNARRLNEMRGGERDRWRAHDSLARRNRAVRIPPITNWQVYFSSLSERREKDKRSFSSYRAAITIDELPNDLLPSFSRSLIPVQQTNFSRLTGGKVGGGRHPTARKLCLRFLWKILRARVLRSAATRSRCNLDPRDRIAAKISCFVGVDRFKDIGLILLEWVEKCNFL